MGDLTIKQKKEWARECWFRDNLTQKEIADKVGLSRQTINKMAKDEGWAERKVGITLTREEQIKNLYRQIQEVNEKILERDKGSRHATPAEADVIAKLSNAIKKMETDIGIAEIVSVTTRFLDWLREDDLDKTKEIASLFDAFVSDHLKRRPRL